MIDTMLFLDAKNPRLGRRGPSLSPREIIQHLFDHHKVIDLVESISTRGYFPNEPLLAIQENDRLVVVEGNRRLAALKVLQEPGLLEEPLLSQAKKWAHKIKDPLLISVIPTTLAPTRKQTDPQIAGRHIGTPVLAWQPENRANFILEKLEEGYTDAQLNTQLGFTLADIQQARQTNAISQMARSLDLPETIKTKIESPRSGVFTTLERVFESTVGRNYLMVTPDEKHGLRIQTSKDEFVRGLTRLVTDLALKKESSRSLNSSADIERYFKSWKPGDLPAKKQRSIVPTDIFSKETRPASAALGSAPKQLRRAMKPTLTVIPKSLRIIYGTQRLLKIRNELVDIRRDRWPNAGSVLLRVFLELAIIDYLERSGYMEPLKARLQAKGKLKFGYPEMAHLKTEIVEIAKKRLPRAESQRIERALTGDKDAPFSLNDLNSFVHSPKDIPGEKEIETFWERTEPLFKMMLMEKPEIYVNEDC